MSSLCNRQIKKLPTIRSPLAGIKPLFTGDENNQEWARRNGPPPRFHGIAISAVWDGTGRAGWDGTGRGGRLGQVHQCSGISYKHYKHLWRVLIVP